MKAGDTVQYAAHEVSSQDDGSFLPIGEEEWLTGKVLSVDKHPIPIDQPDAKPDVVVSIEPDSGAPPFALNAKLVREV